MPVKSGEVSVIKFIPSIEKDEKTPSTICCVPLSKSQYDKYLNSLAEYKKNKFISHADTAFAKLCELSLSADEKGNYLYNFIWEGKLIDSVNDKALAIKILGGMKDIEAANEIENFMKGQSTLNEDEEKN